MEATPDMSQMVMLVPLIIGYFVFAVVMMVLPTIAFWKICAKAGFSGALGLLILVPVGNLILPLYLAFAKWPALKETVTHDQ
jgi:hypothetical protein